MDLKAHLLTEARRHCAARNISLGRLGILVVNDGKFFRRIEAGGDFGVRTYDRFMDYFRDNPVPVETGDIELSAPRPRIPLSGAAHVAAAQACGGR